MESSRQAARGYRRAFSLACLVTAGSTCYDLPYVFTGNFRPVALEVFSLTDAEAGVLVSFYGLTGLLLYLPGGYIADLFSPYPLMSSGLILTGVGGFYFATIPSFATLWGLFLAWSITSIMMFWPASIKAVRDWGDSDAQGWSWSLFNVLCYLAAAVKQAVITYYFSSLLPQGVEQASELEQRVAIQSVIYIYSALACVAGMIMICSQVLLQIGPPPHDPVDSHEASEHSMWGTLHNSKIQLMACILMSSYFCAHVLNYVPQFAINGFSATVVEAAWLDTIGMWTQPVAALAVGFYADHLRCSMVCVICMSVILIVYTSMFFIGPQPGQLWVVLVYALMTNAALASLSSVFWAYLQEVQIPLCFTGLASGVVSSIGYCPDAFAPALLGYLMDSSPGYKGDQHCMIIGVGFALLGTFASFRLKDLSRMSHSVGLGNSEYQTSETSRIITKNIEGPPRYLSIT